MTPELLQLIAKVVEREQVGTLYLGKGARVRRFFFSSGEIHLLEPGKDCRFLPQPFLFDNDNISRAAVEEMAVRIRREPQSLAALLEERGQLPREQLENFYLEETLEEILLVMSRNGDHFFFEEGSVPEELLSPTQRHSGILLKKFVEALQRRRAELRDFVALFPSQEELLVLSEKGIQAQNAGQDWLFMQVADLIDGFRTIRSLLSDGFLFPHFTAMTLVHAAKTGWIKKTVFPELEDLRPDQLTPPQALAQIPVFTQAAEMAVDDLAIRGRLAEICLRAGEVDQAIFQFNLIGDVLQRRNEFVASLDTYREALRWDPDSILLQEKVVRTYLQFAETSFKNGQADDGRRLVEEALRYHGSSLHLYLRIVDSYDSMEEVLQVAVPRLLKIMNKAGEKQLPMQLFEELVTRDTQNDSLRKRFVNFLLDNGNKERAVRELELLAGSLLDRGESTEAQQIYEKIARLAPSEETEKRVERLQQHPNANRKLFRPTLAGMSFVFLLTLVGGYQLYALLLLVDLNSKADALVQQELPRAGSVDHREYCSDAALMLQDLRSFQRRHFATFWSGFASRTEGLLEKRTLFLEQQLLRKLETAFGEAERAEILGRADQAQLLYREVKRLGVGTLWEQRAAGRMTKLDTYLAKAEAYLDEAKRAEAMGELTEAFELYQSLLFEFPRSPAAKKLRIPITVESNPAGATVRLGNSIIGKTPVVVRVKPFESTRLTLERRGFENHELILENPTEPVVRVPLTRE